MDVLPDPRPTHDHRLGLALRMVQIDRADRLGAVRAGGIALVRWVDPGAVVALQVLARATARTPQHGSARGRPA